MRRFAARQEILMAPILLLVSTLIGVFLLVLRDFVRELNRPRRTEASSRPSSIRSNFYTKAADTYPWHSHAHDAALAPDVDDDAFFLGALPDQTIGRTEDPWRLSNDWTPSDFDQPHPDGATHSIAFAEDLSPAFNPATGLPMIGDATDVGGNPYGSDLRDLI